ncbi:MAG: HlyD family secretion protein [Opitutales bacterium]
MANTTQYHSPEEMRDSIETLFGAHGRGRPVIYWALLVVVLSFIVSLPLVKVDTSVGAPGQVRPDVERLAVYPAASGRIRHLHVRDNQFVREGDLLLEIDATALEARLDRNMFETRDNELALADLGSLLEAGSWARVLEAFVASGDSLREAPASAVVELPTFPRPPLRHPAYLRQQAVLISDLEGLQLRLDEALRGLFRMRSLHLKDLISDQKFEQQAFAAQAVLRETELALQRTLSQWQSDRAERQLRASFLQAEGEQLREEAARYRVVAPVDGTAIGFAGLHQGLFLPLDQPIGEISPVGRLQADVYLRPGDVGFVRPDQPVSLQVEAFPYTEWGTIQGHVRSLSEDVVQIGQQLVFRAVVDLETTELSSSGGASVQIRRGMTVQARFILQKRSLFDLLFGKMSESLDPRAGPSDS